uniref:ATP synthase complex subunit 8 n=1 Tax=Pseudoniphargus carpalis TaxID=2211484 RepID=A0A345K5Q4_9CRUS|nr:ATP synthase F0 subunit 8 [Pseudoniphargus carpalis]AXH38196.1 ATP synthase F0 subunit 8 [Pseudoniphargus carpalis]
MPQMAPILWLFLFISFLLLTYFLMNLVFFTYSPLKNNEMDPRQHSSFLHWKW